MRKLLVPILMALSTQVYAQNVIFKCVDNEGNTTYLNVTSAKSGSCTRTDLAQIDKLSIVESSGKSMKSSSAGPITMVIKDDEQRIRDSKRQLILTSELNDEKEQLETVNNMLKNVNAQDSGQSSQLLEMQQTHQKNIASLEKELGKSTLASSDKTPVISVVSTKEQNSSNALNLPISMPATPGNMNNLDIQDSITPVKPKIKKIKVVDKSATSNTTSMTASVEKVSAPVAFTPSTNISPSEFLLGK